MVANAIPTVKKVNTNVVTLTKTWIYIQYPGIKSRKNAEDIDVGRSSPKMSVPIVPCATHAFRLLSAAVVVYDVGCSVAVAVVEHYAANYCLI